MTSFTFKSVSSTSKGLTVQSVKEPIVPAVKQKIHNPEFMNGSIDFSDLTGSLAYEDKVIEYTCRFKCADIDAFKTKIADISTWLTGKGTLITTMGETYSNARCYGSIDITPQLCGRYGEFNVNFVVKPFKDVV